MTQMQDFNRSLVEQFRANDGTVKTGPFQDAPLLLLTTRGARSGRPHTTPLVFTTDGDRIVVIASKGGAPTHPQWYRNVVANPIVTVELGTESFEARAVVTAGEERERLYRSQAEKMPFFADYARRTTRQIPVIVLERTG